MSGVDEETLKAARDAAWKAVWDRDDFFEDVYDNARLWGAVHVAVEAFEATVASAEGAS